MRGSCSRSGRRRRWEICWPASSRTSCRRRWGSFASGTSRRGARCPAGGAEGGRGGGVGAAPAVFGPLGVALVEFARVRAALEGELAAHAKSDAGESDVRRAILLAWLAVRPMAVDRTARSGVLCRELVDGFAER